MTTLYKLEGEPAPFVYQNDAFVSAGAERGPAGKYRLALEYPVGQDTVLTVEFSPQAEEVMLVLTVIESGRLIEGETIRIKVDSKEDESRTDEWGEARSSIAASFEHLQILLPARQEDVVAEIRQLTLGVDDVIEIWLERSDDGTFAVFPAHGWRVPFDGTPEGLVAVLDDPDGYPVSDERGRSITSKDLTRWLKTAKGCLVTPPRGGSSHFKVTSPDGKRTIIPMHNGTLPTGTARAIVRQLDLDWAELWA